MWCLEDVVVVEIVAEEVGGGDTKSERDIMEVAAEFAQGFWAEREGLRGLSLSRRFTEEEERPTHFFLTSLSRKKRTKRIFFSSAIRQPFFLLSVNELSRPKPYGKASCSAFMLTAFPTHVRRAGWYSRHPDLPVGNDRPWRGREREREGTFCLPLYFCRSLRSNRVKVVSKVALP